MSHSSRCPTPTFQCASADKFVETGIGEIAQIKLIEPQSRRDRMFIGNSEHLI